jgi:electron transport complex protein RnfD
MQTNDYRFQVSFPPHILAKKNYSGINRDHLIALIPAVLAGIYYFREGALKVMVIAVAAAVFCEMGMQKFLKRDRTLSDGHAVLIGLLFGFLLPPTVPWWLVVVGVGSSIAIGKMIFGETGNNPFHPALVGWVMVRLSWPEKVTDWAEPMSGWVPDPPLNVLKFDGIEAFYDFDYQLLDCFLGKQPGGIGTVCAAAILAGGLYLLIRRVVSWQIPLGVLGSVFFFSGILWLVNKETTINPLFHLVTGGTLLGAFFLATDPVTSPVTRWGKLIYGMICGVLIMVIRAWGKYPDGVAFAILLANTSTPLINKIRPRPYGKERGIA